MSALPMVFGIGILALMMSKSKTNSESKKKLIIEAKPVKIECLSNQYLDKNGKCQFFWIDGETDKIVEKEIVSQLSKLNLKIIDGKSWDLVCLDTSETQANPNYLTITKNIIVKLWPQVPVTSLPPGNGAPDWMKEIWKRTSKIYYLKTCGITI